MSKVLVTGAGGFIGSHLVEALLKRGDRVRAFVRYKSDNSWGWIDAFARDVRREIEVVRGDLKDAWAVGRAVAGCDVVYHLGALIAIPYSYVHPNDFVQTNVAGTLNVAEACRAAGVGRLVHTSTSEVYGTAVRVPIGEDHPLQAQSPYSATKIAADKLVESFFRSFELPVVTVRPFNTYGPRQSARAVIPTIITQALTQPRLRLGRLDPVRDLTFVQDTVEGFVRAGTRRGVEGETLNLGTGRGVRVGDLVRIVLQRVGRKIPVVTDRARVRPSASEVLRLISDPRRASKALGWRPRVSLERGLELTVEWVRANLERYKAEVYNW